MKPKRKAIIYARFSPRRDADKSESIETQIEICTDYCAKHKIEVVECFEDRAFSGSDVERPGLWAAVEALRKDYLLVVYRLDRLARDVYLSFIIERKIKERRARMVSTAGEGTWRDTAQDKLVRTILSALAEYERKVIAARTSAAMLRHQANGRRMSFLVPVGWRQDPDEPSRLIEEPDEQDTLARIFSLREQGLGARRIAKALQEEGRKCQGRAKWHPRTITRILKRAEA